MLRSREAGCAKIIANVHFGGGRRVWSEEIVNQIVAGSGVPDIHIWRGTGGMHRASVLIYEQFDM